MITGRSSSGGRKRVTAVMTVVLLGFVLLVGRLWYLQVLEGARFLDASEKNRVRVRPIAAPRGAVYDRHGVPLVDNRPAFTLSVIPRELPRDAESRSAVLGRLAALLPMPYGELVEALAGVPVESFAPVRVRRDLDLADVAKVEEWKLELPGVIVEAEPQRSYPSRRFAAHLLGYVRDASGQSGLERTLDGVLRGRDGGQEIEVDALGRPVRVVYQTEPEAGAEIVTTVDRRIQEAAEAAMAGKAGAVVVMDPRTGDVLAMVSTPAFEIEQFTGAVDRVAWLRLLRDPGHPLLNRAIQGEYPPGSVFKILVAAAGLQEGVITPFDRVYSNGELRVGDRVFKDWKPGGHGWVDTRRAIAQSCNVFFYQAGLRIGGDTIARYARAFGFAQATGIALGGERPGLLPGPRMTRRGAVWSPGEVVNMAIGQGRVLVTPLQVARFMSVVANGGVLWTPRLVQRIARDNRVVWSAEPTVGGRVELAPAVSRFLREALWAAVNDGGTGGAARIAGLDVAGKTGTAQTIANSNAARGEDHAWFAAFAPARDPEVVVVVLVERGGKGGQGAAPIAREVLNAIFSEKVVSVEAQHVSQLRL